MNVLNKLGDILKNYKKGEGGNRLKIWVKNIF